MPGEGLGKFSGDADRSAGCQIDPDKTCTRLRQHIGTTPHLVITHCVRAFEIAHKGFDFQRVPQQRRQAIFNVDLAGDDAKTGFRAAPHRPAKVGGGFDPGFFQIVEVSGVIDVLRRINIAPLNLAPEAVGGRRNGWQGREFGAWGRGLRQTFRRKSRDHLRRDNQRWLRGRIQSAPGGSHPPRS